jgi:thiamine pyrophosphate-dependent acetolactate synthase large subunit-like protein
MPTFSADAAFDLLAARFGVPFARAETPDEIERLPGRAVNERSPISIEAPVGPDAEPVAADAPTGAARRACRRPTQSAGRAQAARGSFCHGAPLPG